MKKMFSIMLCIAMIFSSTAMIFADDEEGIKVTTLIAPEDLQADDTAEDVIFIEPEKEAPKMTLPGDSPIVVDYTTLEKFSDVDTGAWYADGLAWCVSNGILSGKSDTKMAPFDKITRGEIITMLWRVEGEPVVNYFMQYSDVNGDEYFGEAVRWAASEKVADGYGDGSFKPAKQITREELAQIIYNYAKLKGNGFTGSWMFMLDFEDAAEVASWANEAMHWCVMKQIITGSNGKLLPKGLASRAEAATMFMRLNPEIPTEEEPAAPLAGGWNPYTGDQELDMNMIPEAAYEAFVKATAELDGAFYKPVAYLGSQVVAGVNYKFLCEVGAVTPVSEKSFKEVVIFNGLDGSAAITSAVDVTADLIGDDGRIAIPAAGLAGGYYYGDAVGSTMEPGIEEAFTKATHGLMGAHYEPLAVIGQQVVAGINYIIVVKATTVTAEPESAIGVVKLYAGVDGTNEMTIMGNLK